MLPKKLRSPKKILQAVKTQVRLGFQGRMLLLFGHDKASRCGRILGR
jgi:hypothetical protein